MRFSQVRRWALNAEGIAKALPVVAPAARAGKRESESEAAKKLSEIFQKFMPNGLLNCEIVNCPIVKLKCLCD